MASPVAPDLEENMRHIAKESDQLLMRSMGKTLRILAIFDNDDEANDYMSRHDNMACIACFGPFVLLADKYDKGT